MATVGTLNVNVNARTARFSKKMKGVRGTITRMARGFGRLALKVGKFAAILGGVALAALIAMTKAGLASVDMVTKLALSMNTSTEGIIALQHAAKIGGVSVEKMDKAIGKMFKNVGEATMGLGLAKASLDDLGLSADALSKMQADEMFGAISEELSKVTDATTRAFHANALFGRAGIELIPIMLDGAAGIRALRKEADELGITFGSKQGQIVEKANDAWARIGSIWKGLTQQLAIEFAPILIEIANRIKEFVINAGGVGQIAEGIVRGALYVGAAVLDVIRAINIGWQVYKWAVLEVWGDVFTGISWVVAKIETLMFTLFKTSLTTAGVTSGILSWMAKNAGKAAKAMGDDTLAAILLTASKVTSALSNVWGTLATPDWKKNTEWSDFLKDMGIGLQKQADESADALLKTLSEAWSLENVDNLFKSLKDKFMGEGFDFDSGFGEITLKAPDFKGSVETLTTAIGSMKVEGNAQNRLLKNQLDIEKQHLETSKRTLDAIRSGGGLLT